MQLGLVYAFDVGTFTGLCQGRPGERPALSSVNFGKKDDEPCDIFGRAIVWTADLFDVLPSRVFVEQPIPEFALKGKTQANSTTIKFGLLGIITGIARAKGVRVEWGPISTVRKHFLGHGQLQSATAKSRAFEVCLALGWTPDNFDESDAAAIWHWGCHKYHPHQMPIVDPLFLAANRKKS